jgi:hypothetical protein
LGLKKVGVLNSLEVLAVFLKGGNFTEQNRTEQNRTEQKRKDYRKMKF